MNSSQLIVLDSSSKGDFNYWFDIWSNWNNNEVFANPYYLRLFITPESGARAMAAVLLVNHTPAIIFPFFIRPLADESWITNSVLHKYHDISTPYGYGGPFLIDKDCDISRFFPLFIDWCNSNHVVSIFMRLSLFSNQLHTDGFIPSPINQCCSLALS